MFTLATYVSMYYSHKESSSSNTDLRRYFIFNVFGDSLFPVVSFDNCVCDFYIFEILQTIHTYFVDVKCGSQFCFNKIDFFPSHFEEPCVYLF